MDKLERRIAELEKWVGEVVGRAPEWHITSEEALAIFDILAAAGAVECVMLHDWQSLSNEYIQIGEY